MLCEYNEKFLFIYLFCIINNTGFFILFLFAKVSDLMFDIMEECSEHILVKEKVHISIRI